VAPQRVEETSMTLFRRLVLAAAAVLVSAPAVADTLDDVENSFRPYRNGFPTHSYAKPGAVVTKDNIEQFKDVLDDSLFNFVKMGFVQIRVGATMDFMLPETYIEATRRGLNKVSLGAQNGEIEGYVAGRAFPAEPSLDDPRAGEKLAWNYKYGYNWGDNAAISPFYWKLRNANTAEIERMIRYDFHFLNFMHRVNQAPIPEVSDNPSKIFRGIYVRVHEPYDLKNTQLLLYRYENDLRRDDARLYLGFQRRVRRLATGQVTDSFLGTDLMIEDFEGYNGRISDFNWKYAGTRVILEPFYKHNEEPLMKGDDPDQKTHPLTTYTGDAEPDGYQYVAFHGQGRCFPNVHYALRKVYVLEGRPATEGHPISLRRMYIDAQTFTIPVQAVYDRKGEFWKSFHIGQAHPDYHLPKNKGSGVSIDDSFMQFDVQAMHCTTGQFKGQIDPAMNPQSMFTVQHMRVTGQ
jgi:hypothetical protein